jgi:hypothetical protein
VLDPVASGRPQFEHSSTAVSAALPRCAVEIARSARDQASVGFTPSVQFAAEQKLYRTVSVQLVPTGLSSNITPLRTRHH